MKFNLTPVIDIVFLLIIFFMLVCQFIVAENFEVAVPDDISSARPTEASGEQMTTVTVMFNESNKAAYAVGAEKIEPNDGEISDAIAAQIDSQLQTLPAERRVVCLRMDKGITFRNAQHALAGISLSSATEIKLTVSKQKTIQN